MQKAAEADDQLDAQGGQTARTYVVRFWYKTDLRADAVVRARSYAAALLLGLESAGLADWPHDEGFRVGVLAGE